MPEICLDKFIIRFAYKLAKKYPSNCSDAEDLKQIGYLCLERLKREIDKCQNFEAYAITAIAREMKKTAIKNIGIVSAPNKTKVQAYIAGMLFRQGKTDEEICSDLDIDRVTLNELMVLLQSTPLQLLAEELAEDYHPFCEMDDLLSCHRLNDDDRQYIAHKIHGIALDKQPAANIKNRLRNKLIGSGYHEE
jgi:DNA-directed RNA polymerase specialized sigma subunit